MRWNRALPKALLLCAATAIACAIAVPAVAAPTPPRDPVLRIETGGHLALITRISADSNGRWLVTASEDKTARVWDARSGQLISVLRPPIGSESLGALYAAAISPDGKTVVLGGNSSFDGTGHLVHLFDRASGTVPAKSTLTGLEAPITQLAWSRDSQVIAIGLRQEGLRVFRRNLQFVGADPEFNEAIFGADFAPDGRLAAVSLDGFVRVYGFGKGGMERLARKQAPGGKPYSVAYSPDGKTLAIGYQDRSRVDILDSTTLSTLHTITRNSGNLGRIAWSPDGQTLYAAGTFTNNGRFPILAFDNAGKGGGREVGSFTNTIMGLATLPDGSVAAASAEPGWQVIDRQAQERSASRPQGADFRDSANQFRISPNAELVAFRFSPTADSQFFDLGMGSLKTAAAPATTLTPRVSSALSDWKNSSTPRLNGKTLVLKAGEVVRSTAATADDKSVVLGTEWNLRHYTADGRALWETRVPAAAWTINASTDGKWVVAGLGDGSIRWYRLSDGTEQLALFVHADGARWIVWTPSGYYDTSVGGENLVGWHLNRAFNQSADFFSAGRFRDKLYRPDVIQKLLASGDEKEAFRLAQADLAALEVANAEAAKPAIKASAPTPPPPKAVTMLVAGNGISEVLPPIIELRSEPTIESTATTVPVRFEVRSPSNAPVAGIKARVNGKLVRSLTGKSLRAAGVQEVEVPIPSSDAEILLFAENKYGKSDPVTVKVSRSATQKTAAPFEKYDKLYLLIVGISKYPEPFTLGLANKDARDFSHHMARQTGKLYNSAVPKLLIDEQATRKNIMDGLKWLRESVGEKDAGIVFFAGHGDNLGPNYFFIPGDPEAFPAKGEVKSTAEHDAWKVKNAASRWVPGEEIAKTLLSLKGRSAFFVDTCHSGNLARQANRTSSGDMTGALNTLDEEKGVIIFASSTGKELSQEDDAWGNGAFTKAIIEGIKGEADKDKTGLIRPTYLSAYVNDRVRALTKNEQRPVIFTVGIDDPIASKTQ